MPTGNYELEVISYNGQFREGGEKMRRTISFTVKAEEPAPEPEPPVEPEPEPTPPSGYPELTWQTELSGGRLATVPQSFTDSVNAEKAMMGDMIKPPANATHTTVKDGDWSDPDVWDNGVPDEGAVVHVVHELIFKDDFYGAYDTVFVSGALTFEDGAWMHVDTLLASGRLQFGYHDKPAEDIGVSFIRLREPSKSMRFGMVTWGELYIYGQPVAKDRDNLYRSVSFYGPETGTPAQTMHMWSDTCERWYAEFVNMGRTRIDSTLGEGDNVLGRYAIHNHRNGPFVARRPIITYGCTAYTDRDDLPGRIYVSHDSRDIANHNIFIGATATGMHTEMGTEIGEWRHNHVENVNGTSRSYGNVEKEVGLAGAYGVAYQNQSRAIFMEGNHAEDFNIAYEWRAYRVDFREAGSMLPFSPQHTSLPVSDPLASGVGGDPQAQYADMQDEYHHQQVQIPQFDYNTCKNGNVGFSVRHRNVNDHGDQLPLVAIGNKLEADKPFHIFNYSFNYTFVDTELTGNGRNPAIDIGTKTYGMTFFNLKVRNCSHVIRCPEINHNGWLIDVDADCPLQDVVPVTSNVQASQHGQNGLMGPMEDDGNGVIIARRFKALDSNDLPNPANKGLYIEWSGYLQKGVRGTLSVGGKLIDSMGERPWPYGKFYDSTGRLWEYKSRRSSAILGEIAVERSGALKRDGKWLAPLTFSAADVTGEKFKTTIEVPLRGFTDEELERPEILLENV